MTIELKITGMSCQHCVRAVQQALTAVPGVSAVRVELESGRAWVEGDADADALILAVNAVDYQAELGAAG